MGVRLPPAGAGVGVGAAFFTMHTVALFGLAPWMAGDATATHPLDRGHAGALLLARGIRLLAVADPHRERREAFAMSWGTSFPLDLGYFPSIDDLCCDRMPDVVTVCDPGKDPVTLLRSILEYPVRGVILCPPPVASLSQWDALLSLIGERDARVSVCHPFEADPRLDVFHDLLRDPRWIGAPHTAVARAAPGLFAHGYGLVRVLGRLLGTWPDQVTARGFLPPGDHISDLDSHPEPCVQSLLLEFDQARVALVIGESRADPVFSFEFHGPHGSLRFSFEDGIAWTGVDGSPRVLPRLPAVRSPITSFYERLFAALGHKRDPIPNPARDATRALETTFAALESILQGHPIRPAHADRALRLRLRR